METIAHRDLRNDSAGVLRRVAAGESIQVTNHGDVTAVIVPAYTDVLSRLRQAGQVREPRRRTDFFALRRARGVTSHEILADLRADR